MADLFYFMSSLPTLQAEGSLPCSIEDFLERCGELLGNDVSSKLRAISIEPDNSVPGDDTIAEWYGFETYLRNVVAELRRAKMKLTVPAALRPNSKEHSSLRKTIEECMAIASPAAREFALDTMRFNFLDELCSCHYFDMASLEIYYIKLLILAKRASRRGPEGRAAFDKLLENGFAQANQLRTSDEL